MWEKIVLNLLSNAFKFTFEGAIRVGAARARRPRRAGGARHRHRHPRGRGAARVRALPPGRGRHGPARTKARASASRWCTSSCGCTAATSSVSSSSAAGTDVHRADPDRQRAPAAEQVAARPVAAVDGASGPAPFVEEAPALAAASAGGAAAGCARRRRASARRILVVDDNADMRDYLAQLLRDWRRGDGGNGAAALERVRARAARPRVTDVMMPELDGFGLLRGAARRPADARTCR